VPTANLARLLRWNVVRRADKEALVDGERRWTFAELDADVDHHAGALRGAGVAPGDIVAVLGKNSATYLIEMFAIARIGAVHLPLNWRLHERELGYVLGHAGASTLLVDEELHPKAEALVGTGDLKRIVSHSETPVAGGPTLPTLLAETAPARVPDAEVGEADLQRILYTSGTTSRPKGVMISNGNVIANQLGQILELELTKADRCMMSAPLFHVAGLEAPGHSTLYAGGTIVLTRSYAGRDVIDLAARERITGMVLAAQILYDILAMPDLADFDLSALRFIIFGGVPDAQRRLIQETFPHVRLVDTFGMTELCNGATYMDAAHANEKLGAQGTPFPHVDIRIVDGDGNPVPPGVIGEITVRGTKVTSGYWRDAEATAAAWRGGWFHSGDMGSLDEDGCLWFSDRKNDMIRSGGENVASAEIERVLVTHPAVAEAAVVGIPHPKWDEVPKAFVILGLGTDASPEELLSYCADNLAKFKVPAEIEIVDHLPRNDSGKVLKRALRDQGSSPAIDLDARARPTAPEGR
jgi:fatty-acyl-CoA synthase